MPDNPPPRYLPKRRIVRAWAAEHCRRFPGEKVSPKWVAAQSGVSYWAAARLLRDFCCPTGGRVLCRGRMSIWKQILRGATSGSPIMRMF